MKRRTIIFIDDFRKPNKYVNCNINKVLQAFSYEDFVRILNYLYNKYGMVDEIWFDHDLGSADEGNGLDCAKYLVDFCIEHNETLPEYHIQSANSVGKMNIDSYLKSYLKSLSL